MRRFRSILLCAGAISSSPAWAQASLADEVAMADGAGDAPAIIVYGRPQGYDIEKTPTATKTATPLVDVPQAVTVISREQLDDQGIDSLNDALRFVPGVVLGQGEGHRDQITLRGQSSTADFFVDGMRDDAQYYRSLYNTERVEVLKGANALIFGRGGGGGVINRVSKAAEFDQTRIAGSGGIDSFGAWAAALDLGAPLAEGLGARLNATYERFDNHRQYYDGHFVGIAPTLGAQLGHATRLSLAYEYAEDRRLTDRGVPSRAGLPLNGFDKTLFGSPLLNTSKVIAHLAKARLDHDFSDALSANLTVQFANYDKYYSNIFPGGAVNTATNQVVLSGYNNGIDRQNLIGQANLIWKGQTGTIGHTLLIGAEAGDQSTQANRHNAVLAGGGLVTLAQTITLPAISFPALTSASHADVRTLSGYVQDQLDLGDHFKLVAGLRYDEFRITARNLVTSLTAGRTDGKWSPRLGLIYKPQTNISFYTSYAISFLPQSGDQFTTLDATQATLAPERFENLELGLKWDLSDALALTVAGYRLDRSNSRFNDPLTGNALLSGKTRTKGFEVSLVGQLARHLQVALGYALQDGEVLSATAAAPAGQRLAQLPRHQLSAWTRYNVTRDFGIGLGLLHQSSQFATISNLVRLPAFTRIDAALFYDLRKDLTLQLNLENLADSGYFPAAHTDNNISTGKPLNAKLTLRFKY